MKKQGTREQGTKGPERIVDLLRKTLPPVEGETELSDDLWPAMLRKLRTESAPEPMKVRVPWFDWALIAGLGVLLAVFPAAIPVLLYYL